MVNNKKTPKEIPLGALNLFEIINLHSSIARSQRHPRRN